MGTALATTIQITGTSVPSRWTVAVAAYLVVIPTGHNVSFNVPGTGHQIFQFSLANGSTFTVPSGRDLEVIDEAAIDGHVTTAGGSFIANSPASRFAGSHARVTTTAAGLIRIAASTYDSQGNFVGNNTLTMFSARQSGSLLDLSRIQEWDASWNDNQSSWTTVQRVEALEGGMVDLSGLERLLTPSRVEDRIDFIVGSGGTIDLASLNTISGTGQARFDVEAATFWTLPSLATASDLTLLLRDGATFNAPALTDLSDLTVTFNSGATLNLPQLATINGLSITWTDNDATLNAPLATALTNSVLSLETDRTVITAPLTNIDNSRLFVNDGLTYTVAATTYDSRSSYAGNATQTSFSAQQAGSLLNLSSIQSWDAGWNDNQSSWTTVQKVEASDGGVVDFSGLQTLLTPNRVEDRVDFVVSSGGTIDLSSLHTISGTGQARFDAAAGMTWTLPALETASDLTLTLRDGATFNTPVLTNLGDLTITFNSGATVNLPQLTTINGLSVTWTDNDATLNAPLATALTNSVLSLKTGRTVITAPLTNIDNSRFFVNDGLSYTVAATTYDSQSSYAGNATQTSFSAQQAGSLLDLSSILEWDASWNDNQSSWTTVQKVEASDGGVVDLSGLQTLLTPDRVEDRVDFVVSSGGTIDLTSLHTISGSGQARFDTAAGMTWTLPALETASDLTLTLRDGATFHAPVLTNLSDLTITFNSGAMVHLPQLTTINGLSVTWTDNDATLNAPLATALTNSVLSLETGRTVITAPLTNIDNSRLFVNDGLSFAVAATTYDSQLSYAGNATLTSFSAQQAGSLLNLSSIQSWDASWNDNQSSWTTVQKVEASDGGVVDLSGLQTLLTPNRGEDRIDFVVSSGGTIDLSELSTVSGTGQARLTINSGGTMRLGNLLQSGNLRINVSDTTSLLDVAGTLDLQAGTFAVGNGGAVEIGDRFSFSYTNESNFAADAGILRLDGAGGQLFEVGSEDLGLPGPNSGNFGIGQLVIGQTAQRTSADLLDVIDNGNRGAGGEAESLYLYGLGGPDGLRILHDSALILNGLNVYSWDSSQSQMVHLNSLFQPGELRIEYDDGYLQLVPLDFEWDNPLGGDFNLPTNWSDDLLPLASDSALWNLGSIAGYTVQFGTNVATDAVLVLNDNVTYDLGGYTYTTSGLHATESLVVGLSASDTGRLTITNGTLAGTSARVAAQALAVGNLTVAGSGMLRLSDSLTLGTGQAALRVETGGTAQIGSALFVTQSGRVDLAGGSITVGSGALELAASTLRIRSDGRLSAAGIIDGHLVSDGLVRTGPSPATLNVTGDFWQTNTGTLELTINGSQPGIDQDQLLVGGEVMLDGLLDLSLDSTLSIAYGDFFTLIDATGLVSGMFDEIDGLLLSATQSLAVIYDPHDVVAIVVLPGDANLDGVVDTSDFNVWNANKFTTGSVGWSNADFNGDGVVDTSDFNIWNSNKFTSVDAARLVPEPDGLPWLAAFLLLIGCWMRRP